MLSKNVIYKINRQIETELRNVDSICCDPAEKMASLERISKLKELLDPNPVVQPSRKELVKELAVALIEAREETRNRNTPVDFIEALFGMRR
ncbi:MAG: hypothetical protein ABIW84_02300 [Ilumatobacteraceae bacterium]